MTPYYDDGRGIQIFHGDCREMLPSLDRAVFGALVTDPPYGISHQSNYSSHMWGEMARYRERIASDESLDARDAALNWAGDLPCLVFGSWKQPRPAGTRAVLIWDKGEAFGMGDLALPWKPSYEEIYVLGRGFAGKRTGAVLQGYCPPRVAMGRLHPNEKPVGLLGQLIRKCPPGAIVDPFLGSGSTLVAALRLGREAVGIDVDEHWCEVAAKRLQQGVLDFGEGAAS